MNQKKFVNIAIIIGVVVLAGIAGYFILSQRITTSSKPIPAPTLPTPTQTPTIDSTTNAITVLLGQEFTLKKGETARVNNLNVFLKVKDFIYSPCPKGKYCIWSGLAVIHELTVDGKAYNDPMGNLPPETPYDVFVKNSDYKTYATFIIEKPETSCTNKNGISQDECWRRLAKRFNDQTYCNKIQNFTTKDACLKIWQNN